MTDPISALTQIQQLAQAGLVYQPPVPPTPPLDFMDYISPQLGRFTRPCFVSRLADNRFAFYLVRPNAPQPNYPMDVKVLSLDTGNPQADGLFDVVTDFPKHWTDPTAFRLYVNANPATTQKGIKLAPRRYDPKQGRIQIADYRTTPILTQQFVGCKASGAPNASKAQVFFEQRLGVDFAGDLGVQDPLVSIYLYDWSTPLSKQLGQPQEQEEFYWVKGTPWPKWTHSQLQANGTYLQDNGALYNKFIPDTTALPIVPCDILL